jgi:hypothetical protein
MAHGGAAQAHYLCTCIVPDLLCSSVIAVLFTGASISHWTSHSLAPGANHILRPGFGVIASSAELTLFVYAGLVSTDEHPSSTTT